MQPWRKTYHLWITLALLAFGMLLVNNVFIVSIVRIVY